MTSPNALEGLPGRRGRIPTRSPSRFRTPSGSSCGRTTPSSPQPAPARSPGACSTSTRRSLLRAHASRIVLRPFEREAAQGRLELRKKTAPTPEQLDEQTELAALERAFRRLVEPAANECPPTEADGGSPCRALPPTAIGAPLTGPVVLEIVAAPFPSPRRKRLLVADDDPDTELALAEVEDREVVHVRDGWSAIDRLDLAVCAVMLGGFTGARRCTGSSSNGGRRWPRGSSSSQEHARSPTRGRAESSRARWTSRAESASEDMTSASADHPFSTPSGTSRATLRARPARWTTSTTRSTSL